MEEMIELPAGFRFHPTDEEIITHYLSPKVLNTTFTATAIGDVDLNKCEPWDLPSKAKMGEKDWYFFCQRDRKYPTGLRTNRATEAGYWKATGKDKEIFRGKGVLVGMKKTLVFYKGRAPKGEKTNWVMHEFRLEGKSHYLNNFPRTAKDEWAVCKVFHKTIGVIKKSPPMSGISRMNSFGEDLLNSPTLPPLMDPPYFNPNFEAFDFKGFPTNQEDHNKTSFMFNNFSNMINHQLPPSSAFYPQTPSANYFPLPGVNDMAYLNPENTLMRALAATNDGSSTAIRRHCKVEQFSNQSMVSASQETAQSTDRNTEISSVVSKQEMGSCRSYDDLDDPLSAGPVLDLENMWKY